MKYHGQIIGKSFYESEKYVAKEDYVVAKHLINHLFYFHNHMETKDIERVMSVLKYYLGETDYEKFKVLFKKHTKKHTKVNPDVEPLEIP